MQAIEWCHFRVSFYFAEFQFAESQIAYLGSGVGVGVGFRRFEIRRNGIW